MIVALLLALLPMQAPPQAPPVREPPPQAPPVVEEKKVEPVKPKPEPPMPVKPEPLPSYADARRIAMSTNRPLVVYVGDWPRIKGDWLECVATVAEWGKLGWPSKAMIVVAVPKNGDLYGVELDQAEFQDASSVRATIERLRK